MESEIGHCIEAQKQQNSAKSQITLGMQINELKEFEEKFAQMKKEMEEINDVKNEKVEKLKNFIF